MTNRTLPTVKFPIFKKGNKAIYKGRQLEIDHVVIVGNELFVHLVGESKPTHSKYLEVKLTEVDFEEMRQRNYY